MGIWDFAHQHPVLAFFLAFIAAWAATRPFKYGFLAWNRYLRSQNIRAHGWPKAPVDADGDVILPDKDD